MKITITEPTVLIDDAIPRSQLERCRLLFGYLSIEDATPEERRAIDSIQRQLTNPAQEPSPEELDEIETELVYDLLEGTVGDGLTVACEAGDVLVVADEEDDE